MQSAWRSHKPSKPTHGLFGRGRKFSPSVTHRLRSTAPVVGERGTGEVFPAAGYGNSTINSQASNSTYTEPHSAYSRRRHLHYEAHKPTVSAPTADNALGNIGLPPAAPRLLSARALSCSAWMLQNSIKTSVISLGWTLHWGWRAPRPPKSTYQLALHCEHPACIAADSALKSPGAHAHNGGGARSFWPRPKMLPICNPPTLKHGPGCGRAG